MATAIATDNRDKSRPNGVSFVRRRGADLLLNAGVLALLWLAYTAVRGVTADEFGTAMRNAASLLSFQDAVGLPSELGFQRGLLDRTGLMKAANVYYVAIHFPATIAFLAWVWLYHRDRFDRIRNTLIGVTAVGLVVHVIYPLAPPRMINGFVDTAAAFGPNPYEMRISAAANQIAAMPSLHVGWALLVAIGIMWIVGSKWSAVALLHPIITAGVVVVTANHYWTDAIVAATLVAGAWLLFRRRNEPRSRAGTVEATDGQEPVHRCEKGRTTTDRGVLVLDPVDACLCNAVSSSPPESRSTTPSPRPPNGHEPHPTAV